MGAETILVMLVIAVLFLAVAISLDGFNVWVAYKNCKQVSYISGVAIIPLFFYITGLSIIFFMNLLGAYDLLYLISIAILIHIVAFGFSERIFSNFFQKK